MNGDITERDGLIWIMGLIVLMRISSMILHYHYNLDLIPKIIDVIWTILFIYILSSVISYLLKK